MTDNELLQQIKCEYEESRQYLEQRKQRWVKQLVLYNNLRRGDQNIATTTLFSYFNRVVSNLYDDKIQVKFLPGNDAEYKKTEALNKLAVNDYREMDKNILDYDWLWDSGFFGRGYCETLNFDKERKLMRPSIINPLMFGYDPFFATPQRWRYYWKWITRSGNELDRLIKNGAIKGIERKDITTGLDATLWDYKVRTDAAKEANATSSDAATTSTGSANQLYQILEHATHIEGVKYFIWTDRDITKILRKRELELNDGEEEGDSKWPIVIKELFRDPHSSAPISIPDIIEDKHRALNVLYNLTYIAAKDEATPVYGYDEDAISDVSQLYQRQINQHIPFKKGTNIAAALMPINNKAAVSNSLLQFMNILKSESAETVGTSQVAAPMQKGKKTATESALLQQISDLTQSLQSKILAQGEADFWSHWYQRYINNAEKGDIKMITITSSPTITFESIELDDIRTKYPPKVLIASAKEAEYKEMVERREISSQFGILSKTISPEKFPIFLKSVYFPKFQTMDSETLDLIFPKTIDEITAEQENEMLNDDTLPDIKESDDDEVHLYVHARAKNTPSKWAHYFAHEKQLADKKVKAIQQQQQQPQDQGGDAAKVPSKDMNPDNAAVPLTSAVDKAGKDSKLAISK